MVCRKVTGFIYSAVLYHNAFLSSIEIALICSAIAGGSRLWPLGQTSDVRRPKGISDSLWNKPGPAFKADSDANDKLEILDGRRGIIISRPLHRLRQVSQNTEGKSNPCSRAVILSTGSYSLFAIILRDSSLRITAIVMRSDTALIIKPFI